MKPSETVVEPLDGLEDLTVEVRRDIQGWVVDLGGEGTLEILRERALAAGITVRELVLGLVHDGLGADAARPGERATRGPRAFR